MRSLLLAILPALVLGGTAQAADLDALLNSVVEVYGGSAAVARMEAFRVEARVDALMRRRGAQTRRDFLAPDRLRVEIAYPEATEVRVLDGDRGWRGDTLRLQPVTGLPNLAMVYQLLRSTLPWVFSKHRPLLEDRGRHTRDGTDYRLVGLPWSRELDLQYWVNSLNRRVERVEGSLRSLRGRASFATEYRDFRRVAGVLVAFTEENFAGGRPTGTTTLTSVSFAPPDLGPFAPAHIAP